MATLALAQQKPFQPEVGQAGKDVVWVPTPEEMVEKMMEMGEITPQDFVIDLGSGDGRNVIAAAKRGAQALGVEYNPDMVDLSKRLAKEAGVPEKAQFVQGDMFEADILEGHRAGALPPAQQPAAAAAEVRRSAPRHAHRVQHLLHPGLDSGEDRNQSATVRAGAPRCSTSCRPRWRAPGGCRRASCR